MPSSWGIFQTQGLNPSLLQSESSGKGGQLNLICNEEHKLIREREGEKKKKRQLASLKVRELLIIQNIKISMSAGINTE